MPEQNKRFSLRYKVTALGDRRGEVSIYSIIDTWKWGPDDPTVTSSDFDKQLKALGEIDELTIRINSFGGVVSEAIAIRTQLMKHPARKTVDIEGECASAATLIACLPGAKVRMSKGSEYMIHRARMGARGTQDDMLSAYNSLQMIDHEMAEIYAERTGKTTDECYELMRAETWYGVSGAMENGFVDEEIVGEEQEEAVACAVDEETMECLRSCYAHVPERQIIQRPPEQPGNNSVSNGNEAVAAECPPENINVGGLNMSELSNATAEELARENPNLAQSIAEQARNAERERINRIGRITPAGAEYAQMEREAIANGTSVEDYLAAILEKQDAKRTGYAAARQQETQEAARVTGGASEDNDKNAQNDADKVAKEVADMAKLMYADTTEQAYTH